MGSNELSPSAGSSCPPRFTAADGRRKERDDERGTLLIGIGSIAHIDGSPRLAALGADSASGGKARKFGGAAAFSTRQRCGSYTSFGAHYHPSRLLYRPAASGKGL